MIGKNIAQYEILDQLGMGGMGIVYKAKDTNLGRVVALKFLPQNSLVTDEDKARFRREAQAAASLNHPNICTIYDFGETEDGNAYIAMEFIDGPTLKQEIEKGPMKLDRAIEITVQVARGLQAAHGVDIVHRDVKSANIMLTAEGNAKIMDFGLAKTAQSTQLTKTGSTLGTFTFMSPEQARGDEVDARTDIWSLGVVLYELVTGSLPFGGEYEQAMVYSILNQDPEPLTAMRTGVPVALDWIMAKLLSKDPARRYQSTNEVAIDLESIDLQVTGLSSVSMISNLSGISPGQHEAQGLPGPQGQFGSQARTGDSMQNVETLSGPVIDTKTAASRPWQNPIVVGLVVVAALLGWVLKPAPALPPSSVMRFQKALPEDVAISNTGRHSIAVSPDGSFYAYVANAEVYLGRLDSDDPAAFVRGSVGSREVFFSWDSRWVGFANTASNRLMKAAVSGGSPIPLTSLLASGVYGTSWPEGGWIYYGLGSAGIFRVSENGGPAEAVIVPDSNRVEERFNQPQLLPGGNRLLYSRVSESPNWNDARIEILDLESGVRTELPFSGNDARYLSSGHIVYGFDGNIYGAAFDPVSLRTGAPVPLVEGVVQGSDGDAGAMQFSASENGLMAWVSGGAQVGGWNMVWVTESGGAELIFSDNAFFFSPRLSPNGSRIAVTRYDAQTKIWIYDVVRGVPSQLSQEILSQNSPVWNPDGSRIAFSGALPSSVTEQIWVINADLGSNPVLLFESDDSIHPESWSPDGKFISFAHSGVASDILIYDIESETQKPFLATRADEFQSTFSPDGKWLAYTSDATGRYEVYVRPFPGPGGEYLVSVDGGVSPVWSKDTETLYFKDLDDVIFSVEVILNPLPVFGTLRKVYEGEAFAPAPVFGQNWGPFDVDQENSRFLMMMNAELDSAGGGGRDQIRFVVNWFEELKQLVPPLK